MPEAGRVAAGASGRKGGQVNNGPAVDTVERIVREEQIACGFRRSSKIKLAAKPEHYERMARGFDVLHGQIDPDTKLVPVARIREEVGSDGFHGGLLYRKSAQMHVGRFAAGLADAAHHQGGALTRTRR